jgi:hypothetical protein
MGAAGKLYSATRVDGRGKHQGVEIKVATRGMGRWWFAGRFGRLTRNPWNLGQAQRPLRAVSVLAMAELLWGLQVETCRGLSTAQVG